MQMIPKIFLQPAKPRFLYRQKEPCCTNFTLMVLTNEVLVVGSHKGTGNADRILASYIDQSGVNMPICETELISSQSPVALLTCQHLFQGAHV